MSRKIEWKDSHKNADQQQDEFIETYLAWPAEKKWEYLMELASQGLKISDKKSGRKLVWR